MSPNTIRKGLEELAARDENPQAPVGTGLRRAGAGRKKHTQTDPQLLQALESLVEPTTRGDPQSPLRWTLKSTTQLAQELTRLIHPVSPRTVGRLLNDLEYSMQGNRKTMEGSSHPDQNAQFRLISQLENTAPDLLGNLARFLDLVFKVALKAVNNTEHQCRRAHQQ